jgi:hypothetical protein
MIIGECSPPLGLRGTGVEVVEDEGVEDEGVGQTGGLTRRTTPSLVIYMW